MIKAIIFDYGGVLITGGGADEPAESLAAFLGIPKSEAAAIIHALWPRYVSGMLDEAGYWNQVERSVGRALPGDYRTMRSNWDDVAPLAEMIEYITSLKSRGYTVGLLSNITPSTASIIRTGGGYDLFDPCVLSCEVGYAKPSAEIYRSLLHALPGIHADEIVFIDDQMRYLAPAQKIGLHTVLAISPQQIINDVNQLLTDG